MKYTVERRRRQTSVRELGPGTFLGEAPNRAAKELIAAGLLAMGFSARYVVRDPFSDARTYAIRTAQTERLDRVREARRFVQGILYALAPPDPLASEFAMDHSIGLGSAGLLGRATLAWQVLCCAPSCVVYATVRKADYEGMAAALEYHGWQRLGDKWLCPDHTENPIAA